MLTIRTSTVLALILAFGMGLSAATVAADALHTERLIHNQFRTIG